MDEEDQKAEISQNCCHFCAVWSNRICANY